MAILIRERSSLSKRARLLIPLAFLIAWPLGCSGDDEPEREPPVWPDAAAGTGGDSGASGGGGQGGTGNAGSAGTAGSAGDAGAGGAAGAFCGQIDGEPNDSDTDANSLDAIDDCDTGSISLQGTLSAGDQDWFSVQAADVFGCLVDPTFSVSTGSGIELCVYFSCNNGGTTVTCEAGSQDATSGSGYVGCCTTGAAPLTPDLGCDGMDDSAQVYLHVSAPGSTECTNYTLEYHY